MKERNRWTGTMLTLGATIALTTCGNGGSAGSERATEQAATSGAVPAPLSSIEAGSEDIIDIAPGAEWARIQTDVESIASAWDEYLAGHDRDGAPVSTRAALSEALKRLREASGARDAAATMQASNDVSAAVVDLFALYDPVVPADVGRLDVLGRQVV